MSGMRITFWSARLTRLAMLTVAGATALSLAACGGSNNSKPATSASPTSSASSPSSSTPPSASPNGKAWVSGMIASVSGDAIQVTQQTGTATVDFTPSTKISEVTTAQLTDVTAGSCVAVRPTRESADTSGTITAQSVRVSQAVDGKCPESKHHAGVSGTASSVAGNTITVTGADANGNPSTTNVTVTDTTKYTKQTATDAQALAQGKCIAARGTKDDGGTLQATTISVQQADNGGCPQPGGRRHHH
jgi:Domain of unknown function (DUF5666)